MSWKKNTVSVLLKLAHSRTFLEHGKTRTWNGWAWLAGLLWCRLVEVPKESRSLPLLLQTVRLQCEQMGKHSEKSSTTGNKGKLVSAENCAQWALEKACQHTGSRLPRREGNPVPWTFASASSSLYSSMPAQQPGTGPQPACAQTSVPYTLHFPGKPDPNSCSLCSS